MTEPQALLAMLDEFHITDRKLSRARDRARRKNSEEALAQLQREARRYFATIEGESSRLIRDIDRKLDELYQRQYNLISERAIVERRMRGARTILDRLSERQPT